MAKVLPPGDTTEEELATCVVVAEGLVNQRPLTYVSGHPRDSVPLTPAHFLRGSDTTEFLPVAGTVSFSRRWTFDLDWLLTASSLPTATTISELFIERPANWIQPPETRIAIKREAPCHGRFCSSSCPPLLQPPAARNSNRPATSPGRGPTKKAATRCLLALWRPGRMTF